MPFPSIRSRLAGVAGVSVLVLPLGLAGCGGVPHNASLYSVHQPVVSHASFTLDLASGPDGLPEPEQQRLAGWFTAMQLRYGDHIAIADPLAMPATRASVGTVAQRFGLLLADEPAPAAGPDTPPPGSVRVVVIRASGLFRSSSNTLRMPMRMIWSRLSRFAVSSAWFSDFASPSTAMAKIVSASTNSKRM